MHYLDDYFTTGPSNSLVCGHNVQTITQVASQVGIPLAPNKLEGPTTQLVFLGNWSTQPAWKSPYPLINVMSCWPQKRTSLLPGKLIFSCPIIPVVRIFLRRLIDLSTRARLPHHHVTMNCDISWWLCFLPSWNGRAIIPDPNWPGFYAGHWIANHWPPVLQNRSIQWKELYPIALTCLLWGHQWTGKKAPLSHR